MRVLVTGGSGSFGSAFISRLKDDPRVERLVCYSRGEHAQQQLADTLEVNARGDGSNVRFFIGDVRDYRRLTMAMRGITHVVHAAALKVVPKGEYDPTEFVATNVMGSINVAEAAIHAGVEKVVFLSSDKACAPVNLYGSTKLCAEKLALAANALGAGDTVFSVVRYGNVTGSAGSVVPLWWRLAKEGRRLCLTSPDMTRFWMTLDQAVDLVTWALENARGGEVVVPDLPAYRLPTLAYAVWSQATGSNPDADFYDVCGVREGEKMHESMISPDEAAWTCSNGERFGIFVQAAPDLSEWRPVKPDFELTSRDARKLTSAQLMTELAGLGWGP